VGPTCDRLDREQDASAALGVRDVAGGDLVFAVGDPEEANETGS
jgi:hypothetical protein